MRFRVSEMHSDSPGSFRGDFSSSDGFLNACTINKHNIIRAVSHFHFDQLWQPHKFGYPDYSHKFWPLFTGIHPKQWYYMDNLSITEGITKIWDKISNWANLDRSFYSIDFLRWAIKVDLQLIFYTDWSEVVFKTAFYTDCTNYGIFQRCVALDDWDPFLSIKIIAVFDQHQKSYQYPI